MNRMIRRTLAKCEARKITIITNWIPSKARADRLSRLTPRPEYQIQDSNTEGWRGVLRQEEYGDSVT